MLIDLNRIFNGEIRLIIHPRDEHPFGYMDFLLDLSTHHSLKLKKVSGVNVIVVRTLSSGQ